MSSKCWRKVFGFSETTAFSHAVEVDTKGTTILITCELEKAERKRDQIHHYGAGLAAGTVTRIDGSRG